jgi:hypothetical protein
LHPKEPEAKRKATIAEFSLYLSCANRAFMIQAASDSGARQHATG